jgi:hypothetical protein
MVILLAATAGGTWFAEPRRLVLEDEIGAYQPAAGLEKPRGAP